MIRRPPPYPSYSPRGIPKHRFGYIPQERPPLPDPRTSSFWPALQLLGISPGFQMDPGGHVSSPGPGTHSPPTTCGTCFTWNDSTQQCEPIEGCEDGGNIITNDDDTEGRQCTDHGSAVWDSVSNQCECPDHLPIKIRDQSGYWVDCGESATPSCEETHGPGYTRIDGTCVPDPGAPCTGADDPRLSRVNTCESQGYASASPPQYVNRNGECVEVGCDKTVKDNGGPRSESYPCANGDLNTRYASGRCPEEEEHPPGAPFAGDPDSGPDAPRGPYTPVGTENEDLCSDPAFALNNPTICGGRGPGGMSEDMKRNACNARGGQWQTDAGLDINPAIPQGPGVCIGYNPRSSQVSQKKCPDGRTYPRQHPGGVCPAPEIESPRWTPESEMHGELFGGFTTPGTGGTSGANPIVDAVNAIASGASSRASATEPPQKKVDVRRKPLKAQSTTPKPEPEPTSKVQRKKWGPCPKPPAAYNTCQRVGKPSAKGGKQYSWRGDHCVEVGCGY